MRILNLFVLSLAVIGFVLPGSINAQTNPVDSATSRTPGALFPPANADPVTKQCGADTALVWKNNSLVCEQVVKALPDVGSPVIAAYTSGLIGEAKINRALRNGIAIAWGTQFNETTGRFVRDTKFEKDNSLDSNVNWDGCRLNEPNATPEQMNNLFTNEACLHRICNGFFRTRVNAVSLSVVGGCGHAGYDKDGKIIQSSCVRDYGANTKVIGLGCMWPLREFEDKRVPVTEAPAPLAP